MHLTTRNVNSAFQQFVPFIASGVRRDSRNGPVLMIDEPVLVTYTHPTERVLFNTARDVNPFAMLYEALWMLAGRNDVAPLAYYIKRFEEFSDDGRTLNGAYGYRWRNGPYLGRGVDYPRGRMDQLQLIVEHLTASPNSRRAVLAMWNVEDDLLNVDRSKDVCCNLNVMFSLQTCGSDGCLGGGYIPTDRDDNTCDACNGKGKFLGMTVTNRSNDLVWGMLGADYVCFSILQEYLAARLGVSVGVYNHFTNNLHAYCERGDWNPGAWLAPAVEWKYEIHRVIPLVSNPAVFEQELPEFVERHSRDRIAGEYQEPFLKGVAQPMCIAYHYAKRKEYDVALSVAASVKADDWQLAATRWIERRANRKVK